MDEEQRIATDELVELRSEPVEVHELGCADGRADESIRVRAGCERDDSCRRALRELENPALVRRHDLGGFVVWQIGQTERRLQ